MHATPKSAIVTSVAIDLAKDVFELAFAVADARIVERSRLSCCAFSKVLDNRAPLRVIMEPCGSAHGWARRFQRLGHRVELLPAHAVRPYVRGNKTDRTDAAGLLEAARCASIRRVPIKTPEQQGIQGLHRVREFHDRFAFGRHFASALGLTPREHSSGRTRHLGRITKCGDAYLRMLLIHGARAVLRSAKLARKKDRPLDRTRARLGARIVRPCRPQQSGGRARQ